MTNNYTPPELISPKPAPVRHSAVHYVPKWLVDPLALTLSIPVILIGLLFAAVFVVNVWRFPTGRLFLPTRSSGMIYVERSKEPVGYWFGLAAALGISVLGVMITRVGIELMVTAVRHLIR